MKRYKVMRRALVELAAVQYQTTGTITPGLVQAIHGTITPGLVQAIHRWDRRILAEELLTLTKVA